MSDDEYPITLKQAKALLIDGVHFLEAGEDDPDRKERMECLARATAQFSAASVILAILDAEKAEAAADTEQAIRRIRPGR